MVTIRFPYAIVEVKMAPKSDESDEGALGSKGGNDSERGGYSGAGDIVANGETAGGEIEDSGVRPKFPPWLSDLMSRRCGWEREGMMRECSPDFVGLAG